MKKFFLYLISLFIMVTACGCDCEKSVVLFNRHPFSAETITSESNTNIFKPGERIYYLITTPKQVETKMLLVQIFKIGGDKDERLGHELIWGKRVKMRNEQVFYYTDYIVLNETGPYIMKVYSRDNPTKVLTCANFYVKN